MINTRLPKVPFATYLPKGVATTPPNFRYGTLSSYYIGTSA